MHLLCVSHYAGRTGAPLVLLEFERWLKESGRASFSTVFGAGGPLWDDFAALGPAWPSPFFPGASLPPHLTVLRRLVGARRWPSWAVRLGYGDRRIAEADVILANTAVSAREILWLSRSGKPIVWHLHELQQVVAQAVGQDLFRQALAACRQVVAASPEVAEMVRAEHGLDPARIHHVPEFIRLPPWSEAQLRECRNAFRARFGIPADAVVVGACGSLGWRKGSDLFAAIAVQCLGRHPAGSLSFVWVGDGDAPDRIRLQHDLARAGIADRVRLTGPIPDAARVMPALDVLAMTSREDPYPLVMLEAGAAGVPLVAFQGSGGPAHFATSGAGVAVPYLDVPAFSAEIDRLVREQPLRRALGEQARKRVETVHNVAVQAPRLLDLLSAASRTA